MSTNASKAWNGPWNKPKFFKENGKHKLSVKCMKCGHSMTFNNSMEMYYCCPYCGSYDGK